MMRRFIAVSSRMHERITHARVVEWRGVSTIKSCGQGVGSGNGLREKNSCCRWRVGHLGVVGFGADGSGDRFMRLEEEGRRNCGVKGLSDLSANAPSAYAFGLVTQLCGYLGAAVSCGGKIPTCLIMVAAS